MASAWMDQGFNDGWVKPHAVTWLSDDRAEIRITEPFGRPWHHEVVTFSFECSGSRWEVCCGGQPVAAQCNGASISIAIDHLAPHEPAVFELCRSEAGELFQPTALTLGASDALTPGVEIAQEAEGWVIANSEVRLLLPEGGEYQDDGDLPGPIIAIQRPGAAWMGEGSVSLSLTNPCVSLVVTEAGPLWTTVVVEYTGGDDDSVFYAFHIRLFADSSVAEILECSTLPVHLWPAPRPYKEIGSLGKSFWDQPLELLARPCQRPCPTSNFHFSLTGDWQPDRMQTHSTAAWEIMDMPLGAPALKAYTAMRASYPGIDAGWMCFYDSKEAKPLMLGIASRDLAHWSLPNDRVHPVHRTPGTDAEVALLDDPDNGPYLRFPIENVTRKWLLILADRPDSEAPVAGKPLRLDGDPSHPIWETRIRRGDLSLEKVKDWVTHWDDSAVEHPRLLCRRADFSAIREKVAQVPELQALWQESREWRPADRYIIEGQPATLAEVEAITRGRALVQATLDRGYLGPSYAIGLARPMRRYTVACDILWDCFSVEEKRVARETMALAAYIMTDGDWWQYAYRPNETTYLPNFNTDVYACAGLIAMTLGNHPCTAAWIAYCEERFERELEYTLRADGGGDENLGSYYMTTWQQLYMPLLFALKHTDNRDFSADPRVHAGARFILNVMGPPDPRDNWRRQMPPIGHHPHARKAFPVLSQLASFIGTADPELAGQLMMAWRECGGPVGNLYDHSGPKANPFTRHYVFHDPTIDEVNPPYQSQELPCQGAVMRTHGLTRQGSFMLLKAGRVHSHHDEDEGSFHYFGRGVPLVLDGLRLENGAGPDEHNQLSFAKWGQPSGRVTHFTATPQADYVRADMPPRGFCNDQMYLIDTHRSGWTREIVMVRSDEPGGIEYLVVKDTAVGPDACQWNLDVLSLEPTRKAANRLWFPGHPEFNMGMDLIMVEPGAATLNIKPGPVAQDLYVVAGERTRPAHHVDYEHVEHWLVHVPSGPGETFLAVLFPRRTDEQAPEVEYLAREEVLTVSHAEGRDIILLRPNPDVGISLAGVEFAGRAGAILERAGGTHIVSLDAERMVGGCQ